MEGCFMFQWGHLFFRWGGTPWGASVLVGGVSKKIIRWGGWPPMPSHYGKPCIVFGKAGFDLTF